MPLRYFSTSRRPRKRRFRSFVRQPPPAQRSSLSPRPLFRPFRCGPPCGRRSTITTCSCGWPISRCPVDGPEVKAIRDEARALGIMVSIGISEKHGQCRRDLELESHHRRGRRDSEPSPQAGADLLRKADLERRRRRGPARGRHQARQDRATDLRREHQPAGALCLDGPGEQLHISSWPPVWPTRRPADGVNYHIAAATRIRASAHCFEAKVFGLVTAGVLDKTARDMLVARDPAAAAVLELPRAPNRPSSIRAASK